MFAGKREATCAGDASDLNYIQRMGTVGKLFKRNSRIFPSVFQLQRCMLKLELNSGQYDGNYFAAATESLSLTLLLLRNLELQSLTTRSVLQQFAALVLND